MKYFLFAVALVIMSGCTPEIRQDKMIVVALETTSSHWDEQMVGDGKYINTTKNIYVPDALYATFYSPSTHIQINSTLYAPVTTLSLGKTYLITYRTNGWMYDIVSIGDIYK
jgi:hypothetical protein